MGLVPKYYLLAGDKSVNNVDYFSSKLSFTYRVNVNH